MSTDPGEAIIEAAREMEEAESKESDYWLFFRKAEKPGKRGSPLMRTALCDLPEWIVKGVDRGEIVLHLQEMSERYRLRLRRAG